MAASGIKRLIKRGRRVYDRGGHAPEEVKQKLNLLWFILAAVICALAVFFIIMNGIRTNRALAEKWSKGLARVYELVVGHITSPIPVSVFELLIVFLIIVAVYLYIRLVINIKNGAFRRIVTGVLSVGVAVMYVLNVYMLSMGFGYYRTTVPLNQAGADYDAAQAKAVALYFLDDFNGLIEKFDRDENGCVISPYTFDELGELMKDEYVRVNDEVGGDFLFDYTPKAKKVVNSFFMSDFFITGITFLPTGEANVNVDVPPTTIPFTMAHELAHTKGVQREGDANLIAQYLLLSSPDDYLRYCGYYETFSNLQSAVRLAGDKDGYKEIRAAVNKKISPEYAFESEYWASQVDIIGQIGDLFNDIYLKLNGASNGTGSYGDGSQSSQTTTVNPDTGDEEIKPVYSKIQKIYFYLYEQKSGAL